MDEQENPFLRITENDIVEANQLSLHCPICASAVEKNVDGEALRPIVCASCGTLYHKICWEQSGGKCAILGCGHDAYHLYGRDMGPALKLNYEDIAHPSSNGRGGDALGRRERRLKEAQKRQVEAMNNPSLLQRFFKWLLDQIKIG
jgi:Prokaryotic RING finger family 1